MNTLSRKPADAVRNSPLFTFHPSFLASDAERIYLAKSVEIDDSRGYMVDERTRELAKCMHYAAWRVSEAATTYEDSNWRQAYYDARNSIVVGNRKLSLKAVHKWSSTGIAADDLVGECQIVLIKAVAGYNPWLGIRFSTYAFTCLVRALSRLSQRQAAERLILSQSLESLRTDEISCRSAEEYPDVRLAYLDEFFREDAPLLTEREKQVILRRFHLTFSSQKNETLEEVGRDLQLSKERVRQVQQSALLKLRVALASKISAS